MSGMILWTTLSSRIFSTSQGELRCTSMHSKKMKTIASTYWMEISWAQRLVRVSAE